MGGTQLAGFARAWGFGDSRPRMKDAKVRVSVSLAPSVPVNTFGTLYEMPTIRPSDDNGIYPD